jgi:hypothetical protein
MRTLKTFNVSLYIDSPVLGCLKSHLDILKTCIETIHITVNNETSGEFATGVNTGSKIAAGFNDPDGKFATGINDTGGKFFHRCR